ncbi:patatin-like phospholipase family protein [Sphingobacterium pedocola]|uniref:Patatin n=1 Tax=Sphingobacterium pedocola TaxID=2082722 RepID=A0ABR9T4M8_9SPHI|nr:patatin-like phospholipase family protein [Sphingobacterium pedocola]MBE8720300.1 patatin [Sphingobacterium pedocola]
MKQKISLVLGSGGARGITQIGVIKLLEERQLEIDEIVGCSIGSLVGAAYAGGKVALLGEWMSKLTKRDVFRLLDFSDPRYGLFKGMRILETLHSIFGDVNIEDLPIKYTAVATDLRNNREVLMRDGSIYHAIRASIAIPAVFTGIDSDDRYLVDGGVLNPLPVNHVQNKENIIIVVNLDGKPNAPLTKTVKKLNAVALLQESYYAMRRRLSEMSLELYKPDYVIHIPHNMAGIWDFGHAAELIEKGYALAADAIPNEILQKSAVSLQS